MSLAFAAQPRPSKQVSERIPHFMESERALLERFMPGLDGALKGIPLGVLESENNPSIRMLKEARGPALLIPARFGGMGASAPEGLRVLRAIASRSPSLGIVYTMHNFSVCTLVEWALFGDEYGPMILGGIAESSMYVASGFAEGRPGARPLEMTMRATRAPEGGWLLSGRKKPCTLTYSMDLFSCGVVVEVGPDVWCRGVGLVPADSPGIERRPFWKSHVLAGAESHEVILDKVHVPDDFVFVTDNPTILDPIEMTGYLWFQLALSSAYLGVVSNLVERVLRSGKGTPEERGLVVANIEAQAAAIDGIAYAMQAGEERETLLARALATRFTAQGVIESVAMKCAELLGGLAFMESSEVSYFLCASRAMAFHPPGRLLATRALDEYARGGSLDLA